MIIDFNHLLKKVFFKVDFDEFFHCDNWFYGIFTVCIYLIVNFKSNFNFFNYFWIMLFLVILFYFYFRNINSLGYLHSQTYKNLFLMQNLKADIGWDSLEISDDEFWSVLFCLFFFIFHNVFRISRGFFAFFNDDIWFGWYMNFSFSSFNGLAVLMILK